MRLYAIRYAENFKYGTYDSAYRTVEEKGKKIEKFVFLYYLAEHKGKYTLIDTGFRDKELAATMGVTLLGDEQDLLNVFGEMPPIDRVILTHSHWDHANNLDLYQGTAVVMSQGTYNSIMQEGKETVKNALCDCSITLVDDEMRIDDIFDFQVIGGHTPDSSVIYFWVNEKKYVITGDECYLCDNAVENKPIGIYTNAKKNEEFIDKIHREKWIPLPFHDEKVMKKYFKLSENIVQHIEKVSFISNTLLYTLYLLIKELYFCD